MIACEFFDYIYVADMLMRFVSIISVVSPVAYASPAQQATQQLPAMASHFGEPNYVYCPGQGGVMPVHCSNPSAWRSANY